MQADLDAGELESLAAFATGRLRPDVSVLLDRAPVAPAADSSGVAATGDDTTPIPVLPGEEHLRVRRLLTRMAAAEPHRYVVVEAEGTAEEVGRRVLAALEPVLPVRPGHPASGSTPPPVSAAHPRPADAPTDLFTAAVPPRPADAATAAIPADAATARGPADAATAAMRAGGATAAIPADAATAVPADAATAVPADAATAAAPAATNSPRIPGDADSAGPGGVGSGAPASPAGDGTPSAARPADASAAEAGAITTVVDDKIATRGAKAATVRFWNRWRRS
jgi:hypothetical protein